MRTSTERPGGEPSAGVAPESWNGIDGWRLTAPGGTAFVSRLGGQVLSWVPADGIERMWLSPATPQSLAAGLPIRGGVPLCWPWFARQHRAAGDPQHGVVRTGLWSADAPTLGDGGELQVTLRPEPWTPKQAAALGPLVHLAVSLELALGAALSMRLVTRHTGGEAGPMRLTQAFHTYFSVDDLAVAGVTGLAGRRYLDKRAGFAENLQRGEPGLTEPVDRIYQDTAGRYTVRGGPRHGVALSSRDSRTAVLWNPGAQDAGGMADVPGDSWRRFVCLEVAHASDGTMLIHPGHVAELSQVLVPLGA